MKVYALKVVSSENDADYVQTHYFISTDMNTIEYVKDFLYKLSDNCGNDFTSNEKLEEFCDEFVATNSIPTELTHHFVNVDDVRQFVRSMLGHSECDYDFIRCYDGSSVIEIKEKELIAFIEFKSKLS